MSAPSAHAPTPAFVEGEVPGHPDRDELGDSTRWPAPGGARLAETVFALQGLYCAACAGVIEAALRAVPGVAEARVNAASHRARVRWDPACLRAAQLSGAVEAAGYRAVPAQREAARAARQREARQALWRLFVAGFCMMQVMMLTTPVYLAQPGDMAPDLNALLRWAAWVLSLPVLLFSARAFFQGAWQAVKQRRIGMDVPVALGIAVIFLAATVATFGSPGAAREEVYLDSMTMFITFLLAGRWLEARARSRSAEALCANASNTCGSSSGAMPMPVSQISTAIQPRS